mmetsp:Transcript_11348/g.30948  ORF Transcript_11348/g.30948 Transcript_11348/m.30948 type:complete len:102 (+) Transcript_11348:61-366(+)
MTTQNCPNISSPEKNLGGHQDVPSLGVFLVKTIRATQALPPNFKPRVNPGDLPPHVPPPSQFMGKGDQVTERLKRQKRREERQHHFDKVVKPSKKIKGGKN